MGLAVARIGDVAVVTVLGDRLDGEVGRDLRGAFGGAGGRPARMVLDLQNVRSMDAAGYGMVLRCLRDCGAGDGGVALCVPAGPVRALLLRLGVHRATAFFNTSEEALRSFEVLAPKRAVEELPNAAPAAEPAGQPLSLASQPALASIPPSESGLP